MAPVNVMKLVTASNHVLRIPIVHVERHAFLENAARNVPPKLIVQEDKSVQTTFAPPVVNRTLIARVQNLASQINVRIPAESTGLVQRMPFVKYQIIVPSACAPTVSRVNQQRFVRLSNAESTMTAKQTNDVIEIASAGILVRKPVLAVRMPSVKSSIVKRNVLVRRDISVTRWSNANKPVQRNV